MNPNKTPPKPCDLSRAELIKKLDKDFLRMLKKKQLKRKEQTQ